MYPARPISMSALALAGFFGIESAANYGSPNPTWRGGYGASRPYDRQRYEGAANRKQCARRRAKNKAARASRKRNRK
jgi:hypothetical protein